MSTVNRAEMNPIPTLALARKWSSSTTSIDSTPGPHEPTWFGSRRKAHTVSRGASIWTVPWNCMRLSGLRLRLDQRQAALRRR
jgi:hypothetical protein